MTIFYQEEQLVKKLAALLLVLGIVFTLAACGGGGTGGGDTASGKTVIYWIGKVQGGTYWSGVEAGLFAAEKEFDLEIRQFGIERETDVEKQVNLLMDAVTAAPAAIMIAPCDSFALTTPVQEAYATGIPIILVDTKINDTEGFSAAILTNNFEAGRTCARLMAEFLKKEGKTKGYIGVDVASIGSQTVLDRIDGFKDYWAKDAGLPDVEVLWDELKIDDGDQTKTLSNTKDLMTAYGDELIGFWGANGSSVACGLAMKETGNTEIVVIGMDFNIDSYNHVRDGWMRGSCAQNTFRMGYEGTQLALQAIDGKTWEGAAKFVDSGLIPITLDNIDSAEVQDLLERINSANK